MDEEINEISVVAVAAGFANFVHRGQIDKAGQPYFYHPARVARSLRKLGMDDAVVAAGYLHDVVEDTPATAEDLLDLGFSQRTVDAVKLVTKKPGQSLDGYYGAIRKNPDAMQVKIADIADNLDPERLKLLLPSVQERLKEKYLRAIQYLENGVWP
jgi:(p)ppGpp synthase/HD superfamily hydrolase